MDPEPYKFADILIAIEPIAQNLTIGLAIVSVLLILLSLISGYEIAYFNLTQIDKDNLKQSKSKRSNLALKLIDESNKLLVTIHIVNIIIVTTAIILLTLLAYFLFVGNEYQVLYMVITHVIAIIFILLFGDVMPKIFIRKLSLKYIKTMAVAMNIVIKILYPLSLVMIKTTDIVNKANKKQRKKDISIEELSQAIERVSDDLKDDKEMLEGIISASNLEVKEILTSRIDVFAIEYNTKFSEVIELVIESGFSRIPVYVENLDDIKGILYTKDILPYIAKHSAEDFNWQKLLRPHFIVPETKKIMELLADFKRKKLHLAVVVDEYGGASGLVTLEDIIEEVVGEIQDESDDEEKLYKKLNKNTYEFDAKINIVDFCKIINVDYSIFLEHKGDADSLAGLILEVNGEIPVIFDEITIEDYSFIISAADDRRIRRIKLILNEDQINNIQNKNE